MAKANHFQKSKRGQRDINALFDIIATSRNAGAKTLRTGLCIGLDEAPEQSQYVREAGEVQSYYQRAEAANKTRMYKPDRTPGKTFSMTDRRSKAQDDASGDTTYDDAVDTLGTVGESVRADNSTQRNVAGARMTGLESANSEYAARKGFQVARVS